MKKKITLLFVASLILALLVAACGTSEPSEPEGPVALRITGAVDQEMAWTESEVKAMDTTDAERENKEGEVQTYTGVAVMDLLDKAGLKDSASTIVLVADDGYEAEVPLADLEACPNCILSFRTQGGFSAVFPGMSGKAQVKGVVEIKVQ